MKTCATDKKKKKSLPLFIAVSQFTPSVSAQWFRTCNWDDRRNRRNVFNSKLFVRHLKRLRIERCLEHCSWWANSSARVRQLAAEAKSIVCHVSSARAPPSGHGLEVSPSLAICKNLQTLKRLSNIPTRLQAAVWMCRPDWRSAFVGRVQSSSRDHDLQSVTVQSGSKWKATPFTYICL